MYRMINTEYFRTILMYSICIKLNISLTVTAIEIAIGRKSSMSYFVDLSCCVFLFL